MKQVERYFYPAVFSYAPDQEIAVTFPDLDVATSGTDDTDALLSARELLGCVLCGLEEEDGEDIPRPHPSGRCKAGGRRTGRPCGMCICPPSAWHGSTAASTAPSPSPLGLMPLRWSGM
ncbi:MAG: type II toxin-antitoxin system HicB family antitoxin [Dysosmobacter sp.]